MTDEVDLEPVLSPLETIQRRGFNRYDVFRDWVQLMLAALQRDDDRYLAVLDEYDRGRDYDRGNRVADLFSEAFGELQAAMADSNREVLGMAYEKFGMQNDAFGQHFTPHSAVRMMVEMQLAGDEPDPPVTIADPACGSGRMLVIAARLVDAHTMCFGQDEDPLCAQITALNFCFFNIDGVVVCGDSLTMEKRRAWITRGTILGGSVREVDPDDVPWPEAAFESEPDTSPAESDDDQLAFGESGGDLDQSDLGLWTD